MLQHVSEAWKVADEIARRKLPIIDYHDRCSRRKARDDRCRLHRTGRRLKRPELWSAFTPTITLLIRLFLRSAGVAVRAGMSRDAALYGMTMADAKMLDLEDRIGSLEVGKDADFIVLTAIL